MVREQFGAESRVRLFTKANGGKAEALNFGLHYAKGEIIVALDADTVFPPQTIALLARRFDDPHVGALGFIALPNVWVFQILFPLISPVMDLMFVWTFVSAALERLEHPGEYAITNLKQTLFYYALFLVVDWLAAAFAFLLEKREQWSLLWWLFLQRFCYRQVMYYVMFRSLFTAIKGAVVGWGKLERKATVEIEQFLRQGWET